ncbi:hypothetical protein ACR3K2_35210 [Cryptosporidium serpentis]
MSDLTSTLPQHIPVVAPPSVILTQNDAAAPSTSILTCCSGPQSIEQGSDPAISMSVPPQIGSVRFASTNTTIVTSSGLMSFDEFLRKGAPVDRMLMPPFPQVPGIPMFEDGTPDIGTIHSTCNIVNLSQTSQNNTLPSSEINSGIQTPHTIND